MSHQSIAVIIPCYKVQKQIASVLESIGGEVTSIYVVDDQCPENTGEFVKKTIQDPRVKVLFHQKNQGVGGAVMSGYRKALEDQNKILVKIDGDGQMDPCLINQFIRPLLDGKADYAKGNRFYYLDGLSRMPKLRLFGNAVLSFITKLSSGYWSMFDPTNGYTAIHSEVARLMDFGKVSQRYFFESDMLFRLSLLKAVVVDIPMRAVYEDEPTSLQPIKVAPEFLWKNIKNFLKRIFYNYYLRDMSLASIELPVGVLLVLFSAIFGGYHWFISYSTGEVSTPGTIMLAALPLLIGTQFVLSFFSYDIAHQPKVPIHPLLSRENKDD
jgi:dolichol-phosphate mannosyltransferase